MRTVPAISITVTVAVVDFRVRAIYKSLVAATLWLCQNSYGKWPIYSGFTH